MAKYDQGGGCACGLQRVCDCGAGQADGAAPSVSGGKRRVVDLRTDTAPRDPAHLPRCESQVMDKESIEFRRVHTPGDLQCTCSARYLLDGVPLCGKHAGSRALAILKAEHRA